MVTRLLAAPGGPARVTISFDQDGQIAARLAFADLADLAGVAARPGLRIPGTADPFELAVRAVLGQQVSVAGARTLAGRLVAAHGTPASDALHLLPDTATLAAAGLTGSRAATLDRLAVAVAGSRVATVARLRRTAPLDRVADPPAPPRGTVIP